jgi:hypothetical protein
MKQGQAIATQRSDRQDGTDGLLRIEQEAITEQQVVEVALAEGLAGQGLDPLVMRANVIAQCQAHGLPTLAKPEATGMELNAKARYPGSRLQQGGCAIAPAAEGVIYVMQACLFHVIHSRLSG